VVEDAFAHAGAYILRLSVGPLVQAAELIPHSGLPLGSRPVGGYLPGARVLVLYHPQWDPPALIVGGIPKGAGDPRLVIPESWVLRSRVGQFEDPTHYDVFKATFLGNYSAGRPADALPGDWGAINDLGAGVLVGRMMALLRASELAKVEAFWGDDLLRLTGYNLELFTSGAHEYKVNDEGEYNEVYRASPYPWEALGVRDPNGNASAAKDGTLKPGAEEASLEPVNKDQLLIPRHLRMRGYLGDAEKEWICAPPAGLSTETYAAKTRYLGLLEISKSLDGAYSVRSAKEITLEKYVLLPVPKELFAPEDPLGDHRTNYRASDLFGTGNTYELPEYVWGSEDANIRPAQLLEYHAWRYGRYEKGGLGAHVKDWYMPEEEDISEFGKAYYDKNLQIGHTFLAPLPGFGELVIDHRPQHTARYYRSRSCIKQHDDGSVSIEDGYGSQLVMKGGSIFLTCVGDVWAQPGRNFVAWAPHDAILRAGNSADVSASLGDVRLKAERNLHALSGNGGTGGILLESRATRTSVASDYDKVGQGVTSQGVTIKAPNSSFHVMADDIYIGRNQSRSGRCTIDAGQRGTLYLRGRDILTRTTNLLAMLRASDEGPDKQMFAMTLSGAIISPPTIFGGGVSIVPASPGATANLLVGGGLLVHGAGLFGANVATNGGFAARTGAPFVGELERDIELEPPAEEIAETVNEELERVGNFVGTHDDQVVRNANTSPGNEAFQRKIQFSCRDTVDDLKLSSESFLIYESRWQQMLRSAGQQTTWDEPVVKSPTGVDTRPHPGQAGWETMQAYATVDSENVDLVNGHSVKRAALKHQGQASKKAALKGGYLINAQV
jgi:hypothetical protein